MKTKSFRRIAAFSSAVLLGALSLTAFTGCSTTRHPEVTITYTFNGTDYEVDYRLSRNDAPATVQHFIELADAGYYDGMIVHDYQTNALYSGGFRLDDAQQNDHYGLVETDYYTVIRQLEEEKGFRLTQTVWYDSERTDPAYTVYGEFLNNGFSVTDREYRHREGALVMYYEDIGSGTGSNIEVTTQRADGGKENDGEAYQSLHYKTNCATSLFYTFLGQSNTTNDNNYCVFGMATNYSEQMTDGLLAAISEYKETLESDDDFTESVEWDLNTFDPNEDIARGGMTATYTVPVEMPIVIKSVRVTKY